MAKNKRLRQQKSNKQKGKNSPITNVLIISWIEKYLPIVVLVTAAILVFYPPYFQGLFFKQQMFVMHILTGITMFMVVILMRIKKEYSFITTPMDWAALAFTFAYLISLFGAVQPGDAFYGFLKALNYFAIYWIISRVIRDYKDMETIARVLLASAAGVAVIGIMAALGWSNYPAAWDGQTIASTMQYSNTNAAFLAVASLIGIGLWTREKRIALQLVYLLATALMTLVVLCGFSKGAWLVYILGIFLYLVGMPGVYKVKALYGLGLALVAAQLTFNKFYPAVTKAAEGAGYYLLIGLVIAVAGWVGWRLIEYLYRQKGAVLTGLAIIILITIPMWFLVTRTTIDENIVAEASGLMDFDNSSFVSRLDFNRWGWEIIKDYPINGTGSGGWNALYHQYQDYLIYTTETHNYFLQTWIEAGTIGFLAWMVVIGVFVYYLIMLKRKSDHDQWILLWGFATAVFALIAHSLIDFDFSIPAMLIVCWTIIAVLNNAYIRNAGVRITTYRHQLVGNIIIILSAVTLLLTGSLYYAAFNHAQQAAKAVDRVITETTSSNRNEIFSSAVTHYQKAIAMDSCNAEYRAELANLASVSYRNLENIQPNAGVSLRKEILMLIEEANRLKPYDIKVKNSLMQSAAMLDDINLTKVLAEEALNTNPHDPLAYAMLADVLWTEMTGYHEAGDTKTAQKFARELVNIELKMDRQKQKTVLNSSRAIVQPELTPQTVEKIMRAKDYLNQKQL